MQFLLLIYENETRFANDGYDPKELQEYRAFGSRHGEAIKGGKALHATRAAKTLRVRGGKPSTTDGPFAETKEQLGGFYMVEAKNIDEALRMAAEIPAARFGCIEVRPIMVFSQENSATA